MANFQQKARWTFRDSQGRTAVVSFWLTVDTVDHFAIYVNDFTAAFQAVSNATVSAMQDSPAPPIDGADEVYPSAQDKAELIFYDTVGGSHRVQVPGPQGVTAGTPTTIFLADGITVNPSDTRVIALVALFTARASSRSGSLWATFVGGIRIRKRLPRRTSINVLAPDDSSPEE